MNRVLYSNSLEHRTFKLTKAALLLPAILLMGAPSASGFFFQGFEIDTVGWFTPTRVPTGHQGVASKTGGFHAKDVDPNSGNTGTFTRWGGYSNSFPLGGYTTSVDIYLDITTPYTTGSQYANDTRFDWSSAINTPTCAHRRDFVFNAGFYTDTDATGSGPRFVISASTNAGRGSSFPKNPGRDPFTISVEGWYTFEHRFRDNGGVLAVDLTIKDAAGLPLKTWTLSDPSDIIGSTVGGNRYGWFATDEFPTGLAFDTSFLAGFQTYCVPPESTPGKVTGGGQILGSDPVFSSLGDLISLPAVVVSVAGPNSRATFGFSVQCCPEKGNLEYNDHDAGVRIKVVSIDGLVISNGLCGTNTHARFTGMAQVIQSTGTTTEAFTVEVDDCGEPGTTDTFGIQTASYANGPKPLIGGNIQIHR